jgi:amylovoran biosynthesis glycosyltransferase AmsD
MSKISILINNILLSAGTERAVVNLANNLSNNNFQVEIVSINTSSGDSYYPLNEDVVINHLDCKSSSSLLLRLIYSFQTFYKLIKTLSGEKRFVIGTVHSVNILMACIKFFKSQNKYIGCEHMGYDAATNSTRTARSIFYKNLDAVVVLTKDDYNQYKIVDKIERCFIIPNQISFLPDKIASCESPKLLAIGRLTNQKGFDLMLDIVNDVLKKHTNWHLNIIGEGELEGSLRAQIASLNLEDLVTIEPFTKNVQERFLDASVYLMTSRFEGLPMVLLEGKACGLPIISFDCPTGPKELIAPNDGYLIPMDNKIMFQEKLEMLIGDTNLRKEMGLNAFKNIEKYKPENVFSKWESLFNQL